MKNLFLSLAFMLVGTFAFANTSDNSVDLNKIESLINVENLEIETLEIESVSCGFTISFDTMDDGIGSFHYDCTNDNSGNSDLLWFTIMSMFFWK